MGERYLSASGYTTLKNARAASKMILVVRAFFGVQGVGQIFGFAVHSRSPANRCFAGGELGFGLAPPVKQS